MKSTMMSGKSTHHIYFSASKIAIRNTEAINARTSILHSVHPPAALWYACGCGLISTGCCGTSAEKGAKAIIYYIVTSFFFVRRFRVALVVISFVVPSPEMIDTISDMDPSFDSSTIGICVRVGSGRA